MAGLGPPYDFQEFLVCGCSSPTSSVRLERGRDSPDSGSPPQSIFSGSLFSGSQARIVKTLSRLTAAELGPIG
jgi:hypothetical protein